MPTDAAQFEQDVGELKSVTEDLRVLGTCRST
jgi:hypothetical protein